MFKNYFKTAWRNLVQNKVYSLLNILGLATGMAVALLIGLWVHYQFSYDKFLPNHDNVFKVGKQYIDKGTKQVVMATPQPLADALRKDVPGIQYVARTDWMKPHGLSVSDKKLYMPGGMVEKDFLKIFQYPFLKGNANNALQDTYSVILSETAAIALFGHEDPLNKIVRIDNEHDLKVTAVIKDLPANSTLQFSFLVPFEYYLQNTEGAKANADNWSNLTLQTFVTLQPNVSHAKIQPSLNTIIARYFPQEYKESKSVVTMQPMNNWHLYSDYKNGIVTGFIDYVKMFSIIGILILLIACINFINLSTARSEKRAKEVGIRKAIGSLRSQLVLQFLTESVVMVAMAFCICLLLVQFLLPSFNQLTSSSISIPYTSGIFWQCMIAYILLTGLIAGSRPAFYLSSFKPIKVLKGTMKIGKLASTPRKLLVVLQFTCSIALIISTVIIYQQVQHAKDRPTGYDANRLVMTDASADIQQNFVALKNELLQSGVVTAVTQSSSPVTGNTNYNGILEWPGQTPGENIGIATIGVADVDYFSTMGMQLLRGRNFKGNVDSLNVIVNESAVRGMHLKDPINKTIRWGGSDQPVRIIAVVKDALTGSPFFKPEAALFFYNSSRSRVVTYRLNPSVNAHQAITTLSTIFNKYNPSFPYSYNFVDDIYAAKFKLELLIGKLAGLFAALAIFISCLGLFGLAAYTAEQRNKEIGVRKVLGASVYQIWLMLAKDFVVLVLISCIIAAPVALYFLQNWLQQYEYRISISADVFIASSIAAILITLMTISFQSIKAAIANPVKSLRTE
jgi:putative ABC transport system permease protein